MVHEVEEGILPLLTADTVKTDPMSSSYSAKYATEDTVDHLWDLAHSVRWIQLSSLASTADAHERAVPTDRAQRADWNLGSGRTGRLVNMCRGHFDANLDGTTLIWLADSVRGNIVSDHLALAARQISALLLVLPDRFVPMSRLDVECEALLKAFDPTTRGDIGTCVDIWDAIESLRWRWQDAWERIGGRSSVSKHSRDSVVSAFIGTNGLAHQSEPMQATAASEGANVRLRRVREQDGTVGGLSDDLKRLILAGEEAESSDEQDDDPFAELRGDPQREAGFEEELEEAEEPTGIWRRQNVSRLTGVRANARDWRRRLEDYEESEEEEAEEPHASTSTEGASHAVSGAEAERAGQRTLIRFYADHGKAPFERTQEARKSAARKQLKELLGPTWDDGTIESWCVMFERNPRKDRLLDSSKDLLSSGGNPNLAVAPAERPAFGPDKGRGGRTFEDRGGRGGRGGAGSGSGVRGRGRGGGGPPTDSPQARKQKEKRGNQARQRGADRKVAKGFAEG